jgi:hypothetical protein
MILCGSSHRWVREVRWHWTVKWRTGCWALAGLTVQACIRLKECPTVAPHCGPQVGAARADGQAMHCGTGRPRLHAGQLLGCRLPE